MSALPVDAITPSGVANVIKDLLASCADKGLIVPASETTYDPIAKTMTTVFEVHPWNADDDATLLLKEDS